MNHTIEDCQLNAGILNVEGKHTYTNNINTNSNRIRGLAAQSFCMFHNASGCFVMLVERCLYLIFVHSPANNSLSYNYIHDKRATLHVCDTLIQNIADRCLCEFVCAVIHTIHPSLIGAFTSNLSKWSNHMRLQVYRWKHCHSSLWPKRGNRKKASTPNTRIRVCASACIPCIQLFFNQMKSYTSNITQFHMKVEQRQKKRTLRIQTTQHPKSNVIYFNQKIVQHIHTTVLINCTYRVIWLSARQQPH